jgi:hypothetical protein
MSYSNFSLKRAKDEFQLTIYEEHGIFSHLPEMKRFEYRTAIFSIWKNFGEK